MSRIRRCFGYGALLFALEAITDKVRRAKEQEERGEKVTAIGISSEEIADLCEDYLPNLLNPMMSTEEVKEKLHISDATLNRKVASGELPNGVCKKRGHTWYWKKWDILYYIKKRRMES